MLPGVRSASWLQCQPCWAPRWASRRRSSRGTPSWWSTSSSCHEGSPDAGSHPCNFCPLRWFCLNAVSTKAFVGTAVVNFYYDTLCYFLFLLHCLSVTLSFAFTLSLSHSLFLIFFCSFSYSLILLHTLSVTLFLFYSLRLRNSVGTRLSSSVWSHKVPLFWSEKFLTPNFQDFSVFGSKSTNYRKTPDFFLCELKPCHKFESQRHGFWKKKLKV